MRLVRDRDIQTHSLAHKARDRNTGGEIQQGVYNWATEQNITEGRERERKKEQRTQKEA